MLHLMIKCVKKGQEKVRQQKFDEIEMMALIDSSYAIITERDYKKEIIEKLKLQYQEEYDKLCYCGTNKLSE